MFHYIALLSGEGETEGQGEGSPFVKRVVKTLGKPPSDGICLYLQKYGRKKTSHVSKLVEQTFRHIRPTLQ